MPDLSDRNRLKGYVFVLFAAACWAMGGLTAKWLFTSPTPESAGWPVPPLGISVDPSTLAAGRALAAAVILVVYLALRRPYDLRVSKRYLPFFVVFGVIGMAGVHFTYFKAISLTNVATAILLEYLAPVLVLIVSVLFMGHRFTWSLPAGVALSVSGCALVVGAFGEEGLVVSPAGIAWGLAAAVFFSAYSLMGSWAATRFSPLTTLSWGLSFAAVFWMVVLGPARVVSLFYDPRTAAAIVFIAVVTTVIPFGVFLAALKYIPPTNATVTSTVEPVIAGTGAFLLFGEAFTPLQLVGAVLVGAAIAVVQLPEHEPAPILPPQD